MNIKEYISYYISRNSIYQKIKISEYLRENDVYSNQVIDVYKELCEVQEISDVGMTENEFKSFVAVLVDPEVVRENMENIKVGARAPKKECFTVQQMILISVSNDAWNQIIERNLYCYGQPSLAGQSKVRLFEHCMRRLADIGFTEEDGHIWDGSDVAREMNDIRRMISTRG